MGVEILLGNWGGKQALDSGVITGSVEITTGSFGFAGKSCTYDLKTHSEQVHRAGKQQFVAEVKPQMMTPAIFQPLSWFPLYFL